MKGSTAELRGSEGEREDLDRDDREIDGREMGTGRWKWGYRFRQAELQTPSDSQSGSLMHA